MRNAIEIEDGFIVTTDNSGGIGEKAKDIVSVPDQVTAYFAARVALLEQWASSAEPVTVLIHNFSGPASWERYVAGVKEVFREACLEIPHISGSTETNMELEQSAVAVTMIGKKKERPVAENVKWFVYGTPLVGEEVLAHPEKIASVKRIYEAIEKGLVHHLWPVGSRGILAEAQLLTGNMEVEVTTELDVEKSAGPSTVVLLAIPVTNIAEAKKFLGKSLRELHIAGMQD